MMRIPCARMACSDWRSPSAAESRRWKCLRVLRGHPRLGIQPIRKGCRRPGIRRLDEHQAGLRDLSRRHRSHLCRRPLHAQAGDLSVRCCDRHDELEASGTRLDRAEPRGSRVGLRTDGSWRTGGNRERACGRGRRWCSRRGDHCPGRYRRAGGPSVVRRGRRWLDRRTGGNRRGDTHWNRRVCRDVQHREWDGWAEDTDSRGDGLRRSLGGGAGRGSPSPIPPIAARRVCRWP
jgi:hypothetical protein